MSELDPPCQNSDHDHDHGEASALPVTEPFANGRLPIAVESPGDVAALVALAGLPGLTPRRLWQLIGLGRPTDVWCQVVAGGASLAGRGTDTARRWSTWASGIDLATEMQRHEQAGVAVVPYGHHGYPDALLDDPEPPPLIFRKGPRELDDRVRVAVVGTRACSRYGRDIARQLGTALAQRGVDVVSGLASGIDAAAHAGAIEHEPQRAVAVVAGGVDIVYPSCNRGLFAQVASHGALLSEWPLGSRPARWRFPARNRVVAGLSAAVVVIESRETGGSMYTVDEALVRGRAVFAVPGSIHSPVSRGPNKLIADGAHALYDFDDLLDAVAPVSNTRASPAALGIDSWLLEAIGWEPIELDTVVIESGRSPSEVMLEVERLLGRGALRRHGAIVERVLR